MAITHSGGMYSHETSQVSEPCSLQKHSFCLMRIKTRPRLLSASAECLSYGLVSVRWSLCFPPDLALRLAESRRLFKPFAFLDSVHMSRNFWGILCLCLMSKEWKLFVKDYSFFKYGADYKTRSRVDNSIDLAEFITLTWSYDINMSHHHRC